MSKAIVVATAIGYIHNDLKQAGAVFALRDPDNEFTDVWMREATDDEIKGAALTAAAAQEGPLGPTEAVVQSDPLQPVVNPGATGTPKASRRSVTAAPAPAPVTVTDEELKKLQDEQDSADAAAAGGVAPGDAAAAKAAEDAVAAAKPSRRTAAEGVATK